VTEPQHGIVKAPTPSNNNALVARWEAMVG
jgi:uncharacterized protein YmfQ (DUF2313 family)